MANVPKRAALYRMVTADHICPWGLKSLDLLKRQGYEVEDHHLTLRSEIDAFQARHGLFVDGIAGPATMAALGGGGKGGLGGRLLSFLARLLGLRGA